MFDGRHLIIVGWSPWKVEGKEKKGGGSVAQVVNMFAWALDKWLLLGGHFWVIETEEEEDGRIKENKKGVGDEIKVLREGI